MKNHLLVVILMTFIAVTIGCKKPAVHEGCTGSGGIITTADCCGSSADFPNTCIDGPCGCAPDGREVYTCDCGSGKCFNGAACIDAVTYDEAGVFEIEDQGSIQENEK